VVFSLAKPKNKGQQRKKKHSKQKKKFEKFVTILHAITSHRVDERQATSA